MSRSFRVSRGRLVRNLRLAIEAQRPIVASDPPGYLVSRRWIDAATPGHTMILLRDSVGWLFRKLYFAPQADVAGELAFIRSHQILGIDTSSSRTGALWLVTTDYLVASAASDWLASGAVPTEPLKNASVCFDARLAAVGAGDRTVSEFIADSTRGKAELVYAEEFVRRALCDDWLWIVRQFEPGFGYLLKVRRISADGAMIAFCYRLAQYALGKGDRDAIELTARSLLMRCCDTWRDAVIARVPWNRALYVLYLCVYAFEQTLCGRSVTVREVNEALLGELSPLGERP